MYYAIVFLPLLGFFIAGLFSFISSNKQIYTASHLITAVLVSLVAVLSAYAFFAHINDHSVTHIKLFDWIPANTPSHVRTRHVCRSKGPPIGVRVVGW